MKGKVLFSVLVILSLFLVVGCGNRIKSDWGEMYAVYLENYQQNHKNDQPNPGGPNESGIYNIHFYDISGLNKPIMVTNYEYNGDNYFNLYYINDSRGEITYYKLIDGESKIGLLYDIAGKKYDYFITQQKDEDLYVYRASEYINSLISGNNLVAYKKISGLGSTTNNGEAVYRDFDTEFVTVDADDYGFVFSVEDDSSIIRKEMGKAVKKYKKFDNLVTDKINNDVNKKLEEVAKEEAELQKQKASGNDTFTLGGNLMHYGKYKSSSEASYGKIVINNNGTARVDKDSCTWKKGSYDFAQVMYGPITSNVRESLDITCGDGTYHLMSYDADRLSDGTIMSFEYVG